MSVSPCLKEFVLNDDGSVKHLLMTSGEEIVADEYISAMPAGAYTRPLHSSTWDVLGHRTTRTTQRVPQKVLMLS